ncbi:hypothetical protein PILCRDRAFT_89628 [Piloderma croceum F 1598]|uniref:C2 domain-containing protein n=1 Tax=Piloderma croceum (strain F 1598) TaxID=765440 RepID=A0A0C3B279_PILCF|nr:hypothetical protein PILCRDRAFT_89628 [Piloderma croceum F 1598]
MTTENEESYALYGEFSAFHKLMTIPDILPVVSAHISPSLVTKSSNLCVVIRQDRAATQHTSVIEGDTAHVWNKEFFVYGNTSSTLSLSIEDKGRPSGDHCIGHVSINIDKLLDACSEHEFTVLEAKSDASEVEAITTGAITVKLRGSSNYQAAKLP